MYQKITCLPAMLLIATGFLLSGCGGSETKTVPTVETEREATPSRSAPSFLLDEAPPASPGVVAGLEGKGPGDAVIVQGRIGGLVDPLSPTYAAFVLTDEVVHFCDEEGDMMHCPTPWDACCEDPELVAASRVFVQFVDSNGEPLAVSLAAAAGLAPNQNIVVMGRLSDDSGGNYKVILAEGVSIL
jgi:hypothetical protein